MTPHQPTANGAAPRVEAMGIKLSPAHGSIFPTVLALACAVGQLQMQARASSDDHLCLG